MTREDGGSRAPQAGLSRRLRPGTEAEEPLGTEDEDEGKQREHRGVLEGAEITTPPALEQLIAVQRRIAAETGCAFFNTFEAMGGAGTMARWYHVQPRLVSADFMHPLPLGAAKVGALFEEALISAYEASAR